MSVAHPSPPAQIPPSDEDVSTPEAFNRPPRVLRMLPTDEVEIPAPPSAPTLSMPARLGFILIPAITGVFYLIALIARGGQGANIWLSLPIVLISFVSVGFGVWNYISQRRTQEQARLAHANAYAETLEQVRAFLRRLDARQRTIREENDPDLTMLLQIAEGETRSPGNRRPEARLWERRPTDADFLALRIGRGDLPTSVTIKPPQANQFQYTPELRHATKLAHEFALVRDVPVTVSLTRVGSLGISGRDLQVVSEAYALIWNMVVHHAPREVRLAAFWEARFDGAWSWLRWLPHTRAFDDDDYRLLARYDGAPEHVQQVLDGLQREFRQRIERGATGRPHVVVLLDSYHTQGIRHDLFAEMISRGRELGFSVLCLVAESRQVPGECGGYLELEPTPRLALAGPGGGYVPFIPDTATRAESMTLARNLAPIVQVDVDAQHELPRNVRFSTLLELGDLASYQPDQFWIEPDDSWHEVPIGLAGPDLHHDRFTINLNEGFDGVHGMVAGTTGSGKSEFLLTFLTALAVKHSPDRLNLMLIDFKGGATFKDLETLPHTVGMVTDLEGYQAERALIAINSELDRRKQRLKRAGVSNIREYRRAGSKHTNPATATPMTNLLIVIDEFDEMARDYPEFVLELIRVAKQGRSLGVHLLFATQQPSQIKEGLLRNLTYWIALRVTSPDDSKAMVSIPDAAYLTTATPGRGYFRVNKRIVAFQSARVTIPYQAIEQTRLLGESDVTGRRRVISSHEIGFEHFAKEFQTICQQYQMDPTAIPAMAQQVLARYATALRDGQLPARLFPGNPEVDQRIVEEALNRYLGQQSQLLLGASADEPIRRMVEQLHGRRELETELKLITTAMEHARERNYAALKYPVWTAPLAAQTALADLLDTPAPDTWITAPIGWQDFPTRAEQRPLWLDLTGVHGNILILGAAGSGKTTFLRTMMLALAMRYSPADLWMYTIDPGGRGCGMALPGQPDTDPHDRCLPQLADMLTPQETTRFERLVIELEGMIAERQTLLRASGADTLAQYQQRARTETHLPPTPPAILVVIDNLAELVSAQPEAIETLKPLIRAARPFGITFVVTAGLWKDVSSMQGLFETRIAMRTVNEDDSDALLGKKFAARSRVDQPGRAFLRTSDGPVELQTALPVLRDPRQIAARRTTGAEDLGVLYSDLSSELEHALKVASRRHRNVTNRLPRPLRLLPTRIELSDLLAESPAPSLPFARDNLSLRPVLLDLAGGTPHLLIAGGPDSGKSEALRTILTVLAVRYAPEEVQFALVDYRHKTLAPLLDLPHTGTWTIEVPLDTVPGSAMFTAASTKRESRTVALITTEAELAGFLMFLRERLNQRVREGFMRPRLILVLNDLDLMIGKEAEYLNPLAAFAMRGSDIGLHILMTATDFSGTWASQPLIKAIRTERCGIHLGKPAEASQSPASVGIKWTTAMTKNDFPPGRGAALLRGQQAIVQVAIADPQLLGQWPVPSVSTESAPPPDSTTPALNGHNPPDHEPSDPMMATATETGDSQP